MTVPHDIESQLSSLETTLQEQKEHQLREERFAIEANDRFAKNLEVFEKYYPEIFKSVKEYQPRNDFCIHVTKSGHGNYIPEGKSAPLYGENPIKQVQEQISKAVKKPTYTLTEYTRYNPNCKDERIHIRYMQKLGKFFKELKEQGEPEPLKVLPSKFPTAMIFGLGLGYHLDFLLEHTQFDYIFILEPDFDTFFASLFCFDWYNLIRKIDHTDGCLFLHIGATKQALVDDLNSVVEDIGAFSVVRSFCYQHYPDDDLKSLVEQFFDDYFRFQFGFGFYNDAITGMAHSYSLVKKGVPFYDAKTLESKCFKDIPVFIVGNGPSLDEAEEFIKSNNQNALVFACGTAIGSLLSMGVRSDFHVLVERPYRNYQAVLDMAPLEEFAKVNLLALNTVYPDTTDLYKWSGIALKGNEAATDFLNIQLALRANNSLHSIPFSNPNVANAALSFALSFGFKDIYLFGIDNGSIDSGHHSKYSIYEYEKETKFRYFPTKVGDHVLPGNFGKLVQSNDIYATAVKQIEDLIKLKPGCKVYNVGDGAKLSGAIETEVSTLMKLNKSFEKKVIVEQIKAKFEDLRLNNINEDAVCIDKAIEVVNDLISLSSTQFNSIDDANKILKRQQRYLYSLRGSIYSHIFQLLKGTLLYYHGPLVTSLYKYKFEDDNLFVFSEVNKLWIQYLKEVLHHLQTKALDKCDWAFYDHMRK